MNLNAEERKLRVSIRVKLKKLESARIKDLHQKSRLNWIKYGDENTKFFHAVVNLNKSRSRINGLNVNGVWVTEPKVIKENIRRWFKKHFNESIRRRPTFSNLGLPSISAEESETLVMAFSEDEIKIALKGCDGNKAPGPDGFTMKFYKKFWNHIKPFLVKLMNDFHSSGEISIGCNSSFLALIPKSSDPQNMADYRPISLVGSIYKIISKLLTNRLKVVMDGLISTTQSAFVGGRNILDGPLVVSEVVSWSKKKKIKMMVFKVDFEKAYDSINWKFLFRVMELMEFPDKWIGLDKRMHAVG
ncbi:putative RNA-directed DNA polymerase [Helianthus annuus]|nr:putative RNA-directed DNA polymerase [Helianthus annuus]KAJ0919968.1 putative RNA-directed DNA polymerase [Helianthus annuus]